MRAIFILCCVLCSLVGWRSIAIGAPPERQSYAFETFLKGNAGSITIPLKRAGNLLLIEGTIAGQRGNFVLDLGAPYLVLNEAYFREYDQRLLTQVGSVAGAGGYVKRSTIDSLSLPSLTFTELQADIIPLGHIENSRGIKVLGLLGVGLFSDFEIELDVQRDVMYLYRLDEKGQRALEQRPKTPLLLEIPVTIENNVIFVWGTIAGKSLLFNLDSAAETVVLTNTLPGKVKRTLQIESRTFMQGANGQRIPVFQGRMPQMELGGFTIRNMRIIITNLTNMSAAYGRTISGMLGYDFFAQGIVSINFKAQTLRLYAYFVQNPSR